MQVASGLRWQVETEPASPDPAHVPEGLFTSASWVRAHEALLPEPLGYVTVRDGDGVARASAPVLWGSDRRGASFQPEMYFRDIAASTPAGWARFALKAGLGAGYHTSAWISTGEAADALVESLGGIAHGHGAAHVALLFAPVEVAGAFGSAGRPAANRLLRIGHASIELPGERTADYLSSLTQKGAQNVRRETAAARRRGFVIERRPLAGRPPGVELLAEEVERRYGSRLRASELRAELASFAEAFGERAMLFLGSYEGDVVGFTLAVEHGRTLYMRRVGLAYARLRGAFEYFNLAVYAPLEHCYSRGLSRLHLGCGAVEAKVLRGARVTPLLNVLLGASGAGESSGDAVSFWRERIARWPRAFPASAWTEAFRLAGAR